MKMNITIISPGGNITALIKGLPKTLDRKEINTKVLNLFPSVEQVGFYEFDKKNNIARLEMAGGEFCGNATRSLAYLLLQGKKGTIDIKVSGTNEILKAGIEKKSTAFAQMPIYKNFSVIKQLKKDLFIVPIQGITHLICTNYPRNKSREFFKQYALTLLKKYNLDKSLPCSGVIFVNNERTTIKPVVWIRDVETLFYETACATGTTAVGLWKSLKSKKNSNEYSILQPSGKIIMITVKKNKQSFESGFIDGPIKILGQSEVEL